jgi:hypothetical protein
MMQKNAMQTDTQQLKQYCEIELTPRRRKHQQLHEQCSENKTSKSRAKRKAKKVLEKIIRAKGERNEDEPKSNAPTGGRPEIHVDSRTARSVRFVND